MCRNICVQHARSVEATHILFLDPDMVPDAYIQDDPQAKPFWHVAWPFMKANPGCVLAAPYCGRRPHEPVHCFARNKENNLVRITRDQAALLEGWYAVDAVGTGMMLIDMAVFDRFEHPIFRDVFQDKTCTKLRQSQDVDFCLRCHAAKVPVYVNFSCWADHWQNSPVRRPGWKAETPPDEPVSLAVNPSVPVLQVVGQGDKSWQ